MLEVQAGRFKVKTDADATLSDVMKERKFVEGINEEDKLVHLQEWLPAMSEEVWIRVKNAQYGGKTDDRMMLIFSVVLSLLKLWKYYHLKL